MNDLSFFFIGTACDTYRYYLSEKSAETTWIVSDWIMEHRNPDSGIRAKRAKVMGKPVNPKSSRPDFLRLYR